MCVFLGCYHLYVFKFDSLNTAGYTYKKQYLEVYLYNKKYSHISQVIINMQLKTKADHFPF